MPCVVLDKSEWVTNFSKELYTRVSIDKAGEAIKALYNSNAGGALDYVKKLDENTAQKWIDFLNNYKPSSLSNSDAAKINEYTTVKYLDFIKDLNRKSLAIEDIKSVLTNKHKYNIIYTDEHTYLSKEKHFVPQEENTKGSLEDLFA